MPAHRECVYVTYVPPVGRRPPTALQPRIHQYFAAAGPVFPASHTPATLETPQKWPKTLYIRVYVHVQYDSYREIKCGRCSAEPRIRMPVPPPKGPVCRHSKPLV